MHMQNADLFGKKTTAECTTNQKKSEISTSHIVPHNFEAALW